MNPTDPETVRELRKVIEDFLTDRREESLKKLDPNDSKHEKIFEQHDRHVWLSKAAQLVNDIQAATHVLKATHPNARRNPITRIRTNIYRHPKDLFETNLIGTKSLGMNFIYDVAVDNAAALGVFKFLKIKYKSKSFLDWIKEDKNSSMYAMSDDAQLGEEWANAFLSFIQIPRQLASHTLAKQLYWLVGDDPLDNAQFHLLAPLYASSLTHRVYEIIQEHRFGEDTKAAREARKNGGYSDLVLHEYPNLAEQKLGGTKPQNISQLNSERKGVNYLLASCPPVWQTQGVQPPYGIASIFKRFSGDKEVRVLIQDLRRFLESDPAPNQATRNRRDDLLSRILGELRQFTEAYRTLPHGWSADSRCRLVEAEQCWLDPKRILQDAGFALTWQRMDWMDEIRHRFGNWLNAELGQSLSLGDIEQEYWADFFDDEPWRRQVSSDQREMEKEAQNA